MTRRYGGPVEHGTNACYWRGCKDPRCIAAHRDYNRAQRLRRQNRVGRNRETDPANVCAICPLPITDHVPYWAHLAV